MKAKVNIWKPVVGTHTQKKETKGKTANKIKILMSPMLYIFSQGWDG